MGTNRNNIDISELAQLLDIEETDLRETADAASSMYWRRWDRSGKKPRYLCSPKGMLRVIQNRIKEEILINYKLPREIHGWRREHSTKTYTKPHIRRRSIVNIDIKDYYPSIKGWRIYNLWRSRGFSKPAARLLTSLTTVDNQLPAGAPTSPCLGNHILVPLIKRVSKLAKIFDLNFTSYGDEIAVSGWRRVKKLKGLLLKILRDEGFEIRPEKIKVMDSNDKQQLTGIVLNTTQSVGRDCYRNLRALLYNCVKYGPACQNRDNHPNFKEHLYGRIAQVASVNAQQGMNLRKIFDMIVWD